jgi:hypothetical protein
VLQFGYIIFLVVSVKHSSVADSVNLCNLADNMTVIIVAVSVTELA